ncbi:hypothetical protein LK996_04640 [Lysobacter sp. A6]|uniref:Uncharacterized protein n=1 Tax=Noviluteimonas lactosilytica TaxID=2888523 RepID=A0ABS8JFH8_9GAMM|nr:hypothetical protein [Lysobacter lactosilyticus]MCC8362358.1 hypothetical protein [Lysobacter lactosilyticus]
MRAWPFAGPGKTIHGQPKTGRTAILAVLYGPCTHAHPSALPHQLLRFSVVPKATAKPGAARIARIAFALRSFNEGLEEWKRAVPSFNTRALPFP